jgi:cysteine sulfinate desulfinase/cysteine desulfurase-like protein
MGVPREAGAGAVRLSLGRTTTREELETLVESLTAVASGGGRP